MIRKVTHISHSQHDLQWIFAHVAEDYDVKTGWGPSDLETASAGVSNPEYGYIPNQYNHTGMNTVSTQMLGRSTEGR